LCGEKIFSKAGENYDKKVDEHMQEKHGEKHANKQLQALLSTLTQLQQFFTANNIHSITNQNGKLIITFNQNQTNPNSPPPPPPQTITDEELSETSTLMESEQKSMWKKFKE